VEEHPVRADVRWRVHLRDVKVLRVWVVRVGPARPDEVIHAVLVLEYRPVDRPVVVRGANLANEL
jgi:hypothetical protein